jgi:hypothetical protein
VSEAGLEQAPETSRQEMPVHDETEEGEEKKLEHQPDSMSNDARLPTVRRRLRRFGPVHPPEK